MRPPSPDSPLTYTFGEPTSHQLFGMDLFHKLMELVDKNSDKIPEGDYIEMCDTIKNLRELVKPPSFLIDQNGPMTLSTDNFFFRDNDTLPSDVDTEADRHRAQFHQQLRELDEEVVYPGLDQFLCELHTEWGETEDPIGD